MARRMGDFVHRETGGKAPRPPVQAPPSQHVRDIEKAAVYISTNDINQLHNKQSVWSTDAGSMDFTDPPSVDEDDSFGLRPKDEDTNQPSEGSGSSDDEEEADDDPTQTTHIPQTREPSSSPDVVEASQGHTTDMRPPPQYQVRRAQDARKLRNASSSPVLHSKQQKQLQVGRGRRTPPKKARDYQPQLSSPKTLEMNARRNLHAAHDRPHDRESSMFGGSELSERTKEEGAAQPGVDATNIRKHELELDYSPQELKKMNFQDLVSQSFDFVPGAPEPVFPESMRSEPLAAKVEHINKSNQNEQEYLQKLCQYFNSLTMDQYEDHGDEIMEQMQAIMARFRDLRKQKRQVATEFENEVANREKEVTERKELLQNDLSRLKKQGQDVIQSKS